MVAPRPVEELPKGKIAATKNDNRSKGVSFYEYPPSGKGGTIQIRRIYCCFYPTSLHVQIGKKAI